MTTEDRSAKREDRSDAEKVVKAMRKEAEFASAIGDDSPAARKRAGRWSALADFVEAADAQSKLLVAYRLRRAPSEKALDKAMGYDDALARLREVLDAR